MTEKKCIICGKLFISSKRGNYKTCSSECSLKNERLKHSKKTLAYYYENKNNPEFQAKRKEWRGKVQVKALQIVSKSLNPECVRCGCSFIPILEIHHVNGNGKEERGRVFLYSIVSGKRKTDDLRVLCKVCNTTDFAEKKSGRKWKIVFLE